MAAVTVLGLGNVLLGDDAFGPQVVRRLQAFYQFDPGVSLIDLGARWPQSGSHISSAGSLILVKTLATTGHPGELRFFRREEALAQNPTARGDGGLPGVAEVLNLLGGPVFADLVVVGVIPRSVTMRPRMTPPVEAAVPRATEQIINELRRLGHPPRRSWTLSDPDLSLEESEAFS